MRYTEKDAEEHAKRLAQALGKKFGDCWDEKTRKSIVGCWKVDCNPIYGGCIIEEIVNEHGGVTDPILNIRLPPREFCNAVNFALRVLDIKEKEELNKVT